MLLHCGDELQTFDLADVVAATVDEDIRDRSSSQGLVKKKREEGPSISGHPSQTTSHPAQGSFVLCFNELALL